ncbi:MAG: acyl-CoA dehydrogenase family protein [Bacteroidia bacterium]|nr:acyl-CoA dehydrogenase family protein [Bacteroidia bacterium]
MEFFPRNIYNEEHEMFRQALYDFAMQEIVPFHAQWEKDKMVSKEAWKKAGEMGFLGLQVPEEYGGMAIQDWKYNAMVAEVLGRLGVTGPALGFVLHTDIVIPYILHYGTDYLKKKYLPKMVKGEFVGAIAMTEPNAGSDLQNIRTTAVDMGDHYVVNGSKTFITNGYISDVCLVAVKTDPKLGAKGTSLLVMDNSMAGFTKGKPFEKIGMHAQDTCELFFEDVKVPKEHLLGATGHGFGYMMQELPQERLVVALGGISAAEGALEDTLNYVKERTAFGKRIADFQNTQFKLAELATEVAVGRTFADKCVELHCEKKLDSAMASQAKYYLTDLQCRVIDECVQLHGGYGYMWEYRVARAWADARAQRIYAGTNEIMKILISRKYL